MARPDRNNGHRGKKVGLDHAQSVADADQTASDADQTASDRDQASSETDQLASDRDQRAANHDLAELAEPDKAQRRAHDRSESERQRGTLERRTTADVRTQASADREDQAQNRDQQATARDLIAEARDLAAERRDWKDGGTADAESSARSPKAGALRALRERAADDRRRAAEDRRRAAEDRERAARDRTELYEELDRAHVDELTGAYGRVIGEGVLRHEVEGAHLAGRDLVLVYIDVDGLKARNDSVGHAAGDDLLRDAVAAVRSKLGPHDPVVRWGGDEFVCLLLGLNLEDGRRRLEQAHQELSEISPGASITLGLAALQPGDTLEALMDRGDRALLEARRAS